ncbi:MAG: hypothetical protein ABIY62_06475 [Ginsengibacter sp.]
MYKLIIILFLSLLLQKISVAQDTLPKISVTHLGNKVLVSWTNPFTSLTTINIQRSYDSLRNFTTIGSVLNVSAKTNGFVDSKEFMPSQFYRLFISFEGGTYIFTKSHRPGIDTSQTEINISDLQQSQSTVQTWFAPSKLVYTGKENNIIISLPDADRKKYSIKFFEEDGTLLFEIKKVTETYLTLDKVNFVHSGLFHFEVYANGLLIEKHKLYIPKDGQTRPALDMNGRELK